MPTMSLKPRRVNFQETWATLKETVSAVVGVRSVERSVWNMRFSDVYALCVAHPEPLADRLYDETRAFLEEHVGGLLQRVRGHTPLDSDDHTDGLLDRYVDAWQEYSQGVAYLNSLYSYLNLQHIKRQKVSDAEAIYGTASIVDGETDGRQLEVGELGLVIWERVLIKPLESALSRRIVGGLAAARDQRTPLAHADALKRTVASTAEVQAFRQRAPLRLYQSLVLEPYLNEAATHHGEVASDLLQEGDVSHYMSGVLEGLEREIVLARRFLHPSSAEAVRECFEKAAVAAHLPALHAECERLLREERRSDLVRMFVLLRPLGPPALRPLVDAAHAQAAAHGRALLADKHDKDEAHVHFVQSVLAMHGKYTELFEKVFSGTQSFVGALDKACSEVVNARPAGGEAPAAPELLARYCDGLLRKRGASETEADERLAAAIVVFKYIDDKDVFQKYYARALARRLIHQLSASMEQEEAMINRLKAACGYEFTNKLHRMFTDVAVSVDLNAKFQRHLRERKEAGGATVSVQVLQAGAWPLGGAMAPLQPPPQLEKPARLFEQFYRSSFSGRRLAWLHHLCTGELRTRYTPRMYHLTATTPQCAVLLAFEKVDSRNAPELRDELQLDADSWTRHVKPLIEAGLLLSESGDCEAEIRLNLAFTSKRSKIRLTCASLPANAATNSAPGSASEGQAESATCDDDRKMYLQAALVRIMKQRRVLRHNELIQEVVLQARGLFAPSVAMIKKCIESLIDKQYLERAPGRLDTYSYLA